MPVIVVGADTDSGEAIVEELSQPGREVRVFVSDDSRVDRYRAQGLKVALGDVSDDSHIWGAATRCFSAVLITEAADDDRERSFARSPQAVLQGWADAVTRAGVRRVIWVSGDDPPGHAGRRDGDRPTRRPRSGPRRGRPRRRSVDRISVGQGLEPDLYFALVRLHQQRVRVDRRAGVTKLKMGVRGGSLGIAGITHPANQLPRLDKGSLGDAGGHRVRPIRFPIVGTRVVVVEMHVVARPFAGMLDADVSSGEPVGADMDHHTVGDGVYLGHARRQEIGAFVTSSTGAGVTERIAELGHVGVLRKPDLDQIGTGVSLGRGRRDDGNGNDTGQGKRDEAKQDAGMQEDSSVGGLSGTDLVSRGAMKAISVMSVQELQSG